MLMNVLWLNVSQVNSICWAAVNHPDSHVLYPSSAEVEFQCFADVPGERATDLQSL